MVDAISPNSVNILVRSVSNPLPAGPATPSPIPLALVGGLNGLVTALPGNTCTAVLIPPLASSIAPSRSPGVVLCTLGNGLPFILSIPSNPCCELVLVLFFLAFLASAIVVFLSSSFCWNPLNAPKTHGICAPSPSRKKPNTHAPGCNSVDVPAPLVCG